MFYILLWSFAFIWNYLLCTCMSLLKLAPAKYAANAFSSNIDIQGKLAVAVTFSGQRRIWSFQFVVLQRAVKKCTKSYNARYNAQPLFCSLNLLFGDVLINVTVMFCIRSLILGSNQGTILPKYVCYNKVL